MPLPSFRKPPVAEVAMTAHFRTIEDLHVGHLGAYWQENMERLPLLEQHPPTPPAEPELFAGPSVGGPRIRIEVVPMASTPRFWFVSADKTIVVQIQQDRLVLNWRRVNPNDVYPRFGFMRARFEEELLGFLTFLAKMDLSPPQQFNGEILYLNAITSGNHWRRHEEAHKVFRQMAPLDLDKNVVEAEDARWLQRFTFKNPAGVPTGRLYAQAEPVLNGHGEPGFNLTLTARGGVSDTATDLFDFMNAGRERVVRVFDAMTTPEMHMEWEKDT